MIHRLAAIVILFILAWVIGCVPEAPASTYVLSLTARRGRVLSIVDIGGRSA